MPSLIFICRHTAAILQLFTAILWTSYSYLRLCYGHITALLQPFYASITAMLRPFYGDGQLTVAVLTGSNPVYRSLYVLIIAFKYQPVWAQLRISLYVLPSDDGNLI